MLNSDQKQIDIVANSWPPSRSPLLAKNNITLSKQPDRPGDNKIYLRLIGRPEDLTKFYIEFFGKKLTDAAAVAKAVNDIKEFEAHMVKFDSFVSMPSENPLNFDVNEIADLEGTVFVHIRSAGTHVDLLEASSTSEALTLLAQWIVISEPLYALSTISAKCTNFNMTVDHWKFAGSQYFANAERSMN